MKSRLPPATLLATLRKLIISGHYPPGARLAEIAVAESLKISRTPVRLALRTLEQEGLLRKVGKRGLVVREFSAVDIDCAIEVRGVLEGLAARHLAERGLSTSVRASLKEAIQAGEAVLAKGHLVENDIGSWSALNDTFHRTIVEANRSTLIADAITRNNHLPFASADSIVVDTRELEREYLRLRAAQLQHRLIFDALEKRESARVEMLMREHALVGLRYGELLGITKNFASM